MDNSDRDDIVIISYNLHENQAFDELKDIVEQYSVTFLCVQECDSALVSDRIDNLLLADATATNRLGLAVYYNDEKFELIKTKAFPLQKSVHDVILSPADERLLAGVFRDRKTDKLYTIASFHAAPLSATNHKRRQQIRAAHVLLREFGGDVATLMAGDFNYPLFKKTLKKIVEDQGYEITLSDKKTYTRFLPGRYDFVTSSDLTVKDVVTLPRGGSDHKPIKIIVSR